jgi:hypothetical protein
MERTGRNEAGDTAIGVISRNALPGVLALVHGGGFGPLARVFDSSRGSVAGQLERAGFPVPPEAASPGPDLIVLGVTAPGRAVRAGEAMLRGGARSVYVTTRLRGDGVRGAVPLVPQPVSEAGQASH